MAEGYVVKVIFDNAPTDPRWVTGVGGVAIGNREHAIMFRSFSGPKLAPFSMSERDIFQA